MSYCLILKKDEFLTSEVVQPEFPFSLVVRIPGFHPGGPGSIPGVGTDFFSYPY